MAETVELDFLAFEYPYISNNLRSLSKSVAQVFGFNNHHWWLSW